ncbi:unnamed protein product [Paramecium primaurelia]|uniref:Uncharacterized protein n=2 Tax=Paramecium TaxID=5884 RepID=A0A8S1WMP7_9CILI|nr:unnamed protein product [Paramecium primaurelia]CAD8189735.1 unnamed protein product [Paramecium pentaurelia]
MLSVLKGERVLVIDFGALYKAIGLWNDEDEDDDDNSNLITKHY